MLRLRCPRARDIVRVALVPIFLASVGATAGAQARAATGADTAFSGVQSRGADARGMGVDQLTSAHQFDALPDGGRIELQRRADDKAGVAQIRRHLREVAAAFKAGNFDTPGFVHAKQVPGTIVMAAKRAAITYAERDLPGGGEVRITTHDAKALAAVHAFIAFQRQEHHAGGAGTPKPMDHVHGGHSGQ
jgi:hypothetical protein